MSKANRAFVRNEEAVSPVIGVILMVAITVVLAAVVFVLVSNLGKGSGQTAPNLQFTKDDTQDRLTITTAESGANWNRISARVTSCTQGAASGTQINVGSVAATPPHHNEESVSGGADLNAANTDMGATTCGAGSAVAIATSTAAIQAGDYLDFCASPLLVGMSANAVPTSVVVQITDTVANSVLGEFTFANIVLCAS